MVEKHNNIRHLAIRIAAAFFFFFLSTGGYVAAAVNRGLLYLLGRCHEHHGLWR